jgi:hypothetical protein
MSLTRFSIASTCDGYEVVDSDGRAVSNSYETANEPLTIAGNLNTASEHGPKSLARAMACVEGFEVGLDITDDDEAF